MMSSVHASPELEIKDSLEVTKNPFEEQAEIFLLTPNRRLKKNRMNDYEGC